MSSHRPLSLATAVLINVNVMLGIGIFINTVELTKRAGAFGSIAYAIVGIMLLPLIISIAELIKLHPQGGFYVYAQKEISTFAGFLSAWGYFTGKLGSGAIVLHTAVRLIQHIIPWLHHIPTLVLDAFMICLFVGLNTLNMQAGGSIQKGFMVSKTIPIFFAILVGLFLFQPSFICAAPFEWAGIAPSIPLVLFATVGFEAACSISSKIKDPEKNGPRAILISYIFVICTVMLYQIMFYGALGPSLAEKNSYLEAFPALLHHLFSGHPYIAAVIGKLLHLGLAASALGGSYGTMFTNGWNLYTLGQHGHLFFGKVFTHLNRHAIPVACIIVEGIIYMTYLCISHGNQVPLQQLGALGCVLGYTFSVLALLVACWKRKYTHIKIWIPMLGLINCLILIGSCVRGMLISGAASFIALCVLLLFGTGMFWIRHFQFSR
jgi:amino acid transporter